jgi:magnesium-transporting ATPase (P-type)
MNGQLFPLDVSESQITSCVYKKVAGWRPLEHCMALCNSADFKGQQDHVAVMHREVVGDATEAALLRFIELSTGNALGYRDQFRKVAEVPFNHDSKLQLSVHECDSGHLVVMKGAPELIWSRCSSMLLDDMEVPAIKERKLAYEDAYRKLCNIGERVIAFCHYKLPEEQFPPGFEFGAEDLIFPDKRFCFLGLLSLVDPPRPGVPDAISKCRSAGIKVIMITGDHPETAKAVAKEVGIISKGHKTVEDLADELGRPVDQVDPRLWMLSS